MTPAPPSVQFGPLARKKFEYRVSGDELGDYANILKQLICKKVKLKIIAKSILFL